MCDVLDKENITRVMDGVGCVIHCAIGDRNVIARGTENILEAAFDSGVRRFVHMSTCEVYGQGMDGLMKRHPSNIQAVHMVMQRSMQKSCAGNISEKGLAITILRPSIVYGPFSTDWILKLARRLQTGKWGTFKELGNGICNLIYINDLVDGILLAANHEECSWRSI